jgi:DNA mismatch repair protein MutS
MAKPMYNKYYDVWSSHVETYGPKTAVLYQVGGFFEIYDIENLTTGATRSNIREIAEICQFSLSTTQISETEQSLFGGMPEHALPKYEKMLVSAGFTVVVYTQKKGANGSVESRDVDHISSPGCWTEGAKDRALVGIVLESTGSNIYWAAASFTAVTGATQVAEGGDRDRLHQFLCAYPPSELVVWTDGLGPSTAILDGLKQSFETIHVRCLGVESRAIDEAILGRFWANAGLQMLPQARRVLAALMEFTQGHIPGLLKGLVPPVPWCPAGEVRLGNAALEQLGVISLKEKQSLLGLMDTCKTAAGKRCLRERLLRPISDVSELRRRINEFREIPTDCDTALYLRRIHDTSRLFRKVELGSATLNDMTLLLRSYEAFLGLLKGWAPGSKDLIDYLDSVLGLWDLSVLTQIAGDTIPMQNPCRDAPVEVTDCLAEGQAIIEKAEALCASWAQYLPKTKKGEKVYVDTTDGLHFCGTKRSVSAIQAVLKDKGHAAEIVAYKSSWTLESSNISALTSAYQSWYAGWMQMWLSFWISTLKQFSLGRPMYSQVEAKVASIDVVFTVSMMASAWGWTLPDYIESDEGFVETTEARHPMIEQIHTKVPYVKQSVTLRDSGLLLFGLNASGKSSLMKAIGLCTVLAQTGFPVPASKFKIAPFTALFTRILGNDNLWAGLSSFAVEMSEFREVLQYSDNKTLVLGDELCSGTETVSATAIVAAGLETLASRRTKFLFATHLHELGSMPIPGVRVAHLAVHYDEATGVLVYDRTLKEGSGSAMYGLEVCKALGLPADFLARANQIRETLVGGRKPTQSVYSKDSVVEACEVCGSTKGLETHHINHQATFTGPEKGLHAPHNLTTLCAVCHDDHHGGRLVIEGWEETSAGRRLIWSRPEQISLSPEITTFIRLEKALKKPIQTIIRVVEQQFGVKVLLKQAKAL